MNPDELNLRVVIESMTDGVYIVDRDRRITYWNKAAEKITGFTHDEVVGSLCRDNILNHVDPHGSKLCSGNLCPLLIAMLTGIGQSADVFLHHKDGHRIPITVKAIPVRDAAGEIVGAIEVFSDNFEKVSMQQTIEELRQASLIDALTEIGNRRFIEEKLDVQMYMFQRYKTPVGAVMIDVDKFKNINDTFGHDIGDKVLKMVAGTLAGNVRTSDFVGRWGGEEFLILMPMMAPEHLDALAEKMRMLVAESFVVINGKLVSVTISIGGGMMIDGDDKATFLKRLDERLYAAKNAGRNRAVVR